MKVSAGLLMYRIKGGKPEVFLVHPGGPFFKNKDDGVWSIPKGEVEDGENFLEAAKREFEEETGMKITEVMTSKNFIELAPAKRPSKTVHAWAFQGDCDPSKLNSNTCKVEWPPKSGETIDIPEVDRAGFFDLEKAQIKLYTYLSTLILDFSQKI